MRTIYLCKTCGYRTGHRIGLGIHFGYPLCCIEYYIHRSALAEHDLRVTVPRVLDGTGFIACPQHDEWTAADLVAAINVSRWCPSPMTAKADVVDLREEAS